MAVPPVTAPRSQWIIKHKRINSYVSTSEVYPGTRYLTTDKARAIRYPTRVEALTAAHTYAEGFIKSYEIVEDTDAA